MCAKKEAEELEEGQAFRPQFGKRGGLLPIIVQDALSKELLMLGYGNAESLRLSRQSGWATFFSTSRNKLWVKGESSGNRLRIREIRTDCDQDALLFLVSKEKGGACHTKNQQKEARNSCFYRRLDEADEESTLPRLTNLEP